MNLRAKNIVCTLIAGSCLGVLAAQQGGRGPVQTWWVAKTKGGVYIPPNKPLTRLADLKAMHTGQTNWAEGVVKDPFGPVSLAGVHGFQIRKSGERFVGRDIDAAFGLGDPPC